MMDLNPLRLPCRKLSISSVLVLQWRGCIKLSTSAFRLKQKVWLIFCYFDLSFFLKLLRNYLRTLFALYHIKHKDSITCGYLVRCPCWDLTQNRKPKETITKATWWKQKIKKNVDMWVKMNFWSKCFQPHLISNLHVSSIHSNNNYYKFWQRSEKSDWAEIILTENPFKVQQMV